MTPYPMDPVDATGPMRLVMVAAPIGEVAARLVRGALDRRLVACASVLPIHSTYWWKGKVEDAEEALVLFKTVPKRVGGLFAFLRAEHPYDVPEIIELDVPRVHPPYLEYLAETLDPSSPPPPLGGGRSPPRRWGSPRARGARPLGRTRAPRPRR